jgi:hypothetical protein
MELGVAREPSLHVSLSCGSSFSNSARSDLSVGDGGAARQSGVLEQVGYCGVVRPRRLGILVLLTDTIGVGLRSVAKGEGTSGWEEARDDVVMWDGLRKGGSHLKPEHRRWRNLGRQRVGDLFGMENGMIR